MNSTRIKIIIIFLGLYFNGLAQFNQNIEKQIVIGTVDSLYSEILQEQREIWVHLPEDLDPTKRYPVIYLLDASKYFYVTTGMLKQLTPWQIPDAIVVGIINVNRIRDFTPTNVPFSRAHNTEDSGGAENFVEFLQQELQPFVNHKYPTEKNNTIVGHSTAGLFVLYAFLHHKESFDNYLAIEPSLWWNNENLVKEAQKVLDKESHIENTLYVAVANSLGKELDTLKVRKDNSEITEQIRANLNFHDVLLKNGKQLNFNWEYFSEEDHGSVFVPAQYNGLRSIFSWFPFPEMWRFNTPKKYSIQELITPFYDHYEKLSLHMKREVKPDWQLVNDIGFFMLQGHQLPKKALAYLEMNLVYYPDQSKSYLALGQYYQIQKNKNKAIEYYEKAIELDGNEDAQDKLKELHDQ